MIDSINQKRSKRLANDLWWLNPTVAMAGIVLITMSMAVAQSRAAYAMYATPKHLTWGYFGLAVLAVAGFGIGAFWARISGRLPQPISERQLDRLSTWFIVGWTMTVVGYVLWLAVAVSRGFTLRTMYELVLAGDNKEIYSYVKDELFATVSGVTTFTQFGMASSILGMLLMIRRPSRKIAAMLAVLVVMAAVRALVHSERLALLELVLPPSVLLVNALWERWRSRPSTRMLVQIAPFGLVIFVVLLFGGSEYFRSWRYYRDRFSSFSEFTIWRLSGYYTTSWNNSAIALDRRGVFPVPYFSLEQLWRFPLVNKTPFSYEELAGFDGFEKHLETMDRFGNPEYNNQGGLFTPAMDFGWIGFGAFWLISGVISGRLYRSFVRHGLAGLLMYPLICVAILETPRILYLCSVRSFPTLVFLGFLLWRFARPERRSIVDVQHAAVANTPSFAT